MMREVVRTLKAMIHEEGRNAQDWVELEYRRFSGT